MAQYTISYLNGHDETIEAAVIGYDPDKIQYLATGADGAIVAFIPVGNVLSIVRQDDEAVTA